MFKANSGDTSVIDKGKCAQKLRQALPFAGALLLSLPGWSGEAPLNSPAASHSLSGVPAKLAHFRGGGGA